MQKLNKGFYKKSNLIKVGNIILPLVFILMLIVPMVSGIGISPGKRTFEHSPGQEDEVELTVYNNDNVNFTALIDAEGELADYIDFSTQKLEFDEKIEEKSFTYTLTHPFFEETGTYNGEVIVKQELSGNYAELSNVPKLEVVSGVVLEVPSIEEQEEALLETKPKEQILANKKNKEGNASQYNISISGENILLDVNTSSGKHSWIIASLISFLSLSTVFFLILSYTSNHERERKI